MLLFHFNPRSLVGNDFRIRTRSPQRQNFNPLSLVGNDGVSPITNTIYYDLNPRSLVGNDTCTTTFLLTCDNFNPRSLVGNDGGSILSVSYTQISIHVPSWGTTIHRHAEVDYVQFQSTFPRGERPGITMTFTRALPFQSTFPRGERR